MGAFVNIKQSGTMEELLSIPLKDIDDKANYVEKAPDGKFKAIMKGEHIRSIHNVVIDTIGEILYEK